MRCNRGFTLFESIVTVGLVSILAGVGLPVMNQAMIRNKVWSASELIGSQIRRARLLAISRNSTFRVVFDCPAATQFRVLAVTGDPLVDDDVDRCGQTLDGDSGVFAMPAAVSFGVVPSLQVNGRGMYSSIGGAVPQVISVSYGAISSRSFTVTAAGQITFDTY